MVECTCVAFSWHDTEAWQGKVWGGERRLRLERMRKGREEKDGKKRSSKGNEIGSKETK